MAVPSKEEVTQVIPEARKEIMMGTTPIEPRHIRSCLSRFVTGVAVVSYVADGETRGLTVNSFYLGLARPAVDPGLTGPFDEG